MSRIGKLPIAITQGVEVKIDNNKITVKKDKNILQMVCNPKVEVVLKDNFVNIKLKDKESANLWGITRTLINNMIIGVTSGFEKKLEIAGIGYSALLTGDKLAFKLGFSHPVEYKAPEGIKFAIKKNVITVTGADKQLVGQVAAEIRDLKKPEPYKGKGIHYEGEHIRRKEGKRAVASEGAK